MLVEEGADFVEVGVPFSDPLADGPVIQESSQLALDNGMTVAGVLDLVREAALPIPVIIFGYLNPILSFGLSRFMDEATNAGVSGLLLTDLPVGADPEIEDSIRAGPLALIRLVAPTTEPLRINQTAKSAEGFIYLISRLGVTGPQTQLGNAVAETAELIRRATQLPIVVGFGIANGAQARKAAALGDGVVVGSALVRRLKEGLGPARALMGELRESLRVAQSVTDARG